jgi:hypothetical protein
VKALGAKLNGVLVALATLNERSAAQVSTQERRTMQRDVRCDKEDADRDAVAGRIAVIERAVAAHDGADAEVKRPKNWPAIAGAGLAAAAILSQVITELLKKG